MADDNIFDDWQILRRDGSEFPVTSNLAEASERIVRAWARYHLIERLATEVREERCAILDREKRMENLLTTWDPPTLQILPHYNATDKTFWWKVWLTSGKDKTSAFDLNKVPKFKSLEEAVAELLKGIVGLLQQKQKEALSKMEYHEKQVGFQRWVMQEYRKAELQMGSFDPTQENLPFKGGK